MNRKKKVLVVTHDAGGTEIIAAYVKKHRAMQEFRVYTNGPGATIFRRERIPFTRVKNGRAAIRRIVERNKDVDLALVALKGWMTNIEWTAREEAMRTGLRTAVYLEDWRKYRERFGYPEKGWEKNVPDELWAGDPSAYKLARRLFKKTRTFVRMVPNEYFKTVSLRVGKLRRSSRREEYLFLSSPIQEFEGVVTDIFEQLSKKRGSNLCIRLHPADKKSRYSSLVRKYRSRVTTRVSHTKDIAADFARAKVAFGTKSVALAVAAHCHLPAFSIAPQSDAPLPGVVHVKNIAAAFRRVNRPLIRSVRSDRHLFRTAVSRKLRH